MIILLKSVKESTEYITAHKKIAEKNCIFYMGDVGIPTVASSLRILAKDGHLIFYKNSAEGVITLAGAKVTGATIRMWLLNKFISFLAVLSWKTGLKKMRTKCLVGHIYSRPVPFPLMVISSTDFSYYTAQL